MKKNKIIFLIIIMTIMINNLKGAATKTKHQHATLKMLIEKDLENYSYKISFLRLTPSLNLNFGYDSNSLSSNINEISDVFLETVPSLNEKFAIKRWMLVKANQQIKYLFYRKLENLRKWLNSYDLEITTGKKSVIFAISFGRNSDILRPTSEFDIPANQLLSTTNASLKFPFILKGNLGISYSGINYNYEGSYSYFDYNIEKALSRKEFIYSIEFDKNISSKTHFFINYNNSSYDFEFDPNLRNYKGETFSSGFIFDPSAFFTGYLKFGFSRLMPRNDLFLNFKGFIINGEIEYKPIEAIKIKFSLIRQPQFSVFSYLNNFYTQEQFAIDFIWAFSEKSGIGLGYLRGRNNYPAALMQSKIIDKYYQANARIIYKIKRDFFLEAGGSFYRRDSSQLIFIKTRNVFFVRFRMEL